MSNSRAHSPCIITSNILRKIEEIGKEVGILEASLQQQLSTNSMKLRKGSILKTIHSSLTIEGNTLSLDQVRSISEGKTVAGPSKDIKEVQNAIEVYKDLAVWNGLSETAFLKAHQLLMTGLISDNGQWRKGGVAVYKVMPSHTSLPQLIECLP